MQFRTQRGNLLTVCERKTRFVLTAPLKTKTTAELGEAIIKVLGGLPQGARKTMTSDIGREFGQHQHFETAFGMATFFCDPHPPWQRGTIDNTNAIPRRDMPRKTDITNYTARDIRGIARAVNSTPRKCLAYKTPAEAVLENLSCCT